MNEINDDIFTSAIASEKDLSESKTSKLDDLLKEKLDNAFHKKTSQVMHNEIAKIAIEHSPIDLAYAVSHLPSFARPILYDNLPNREAKIHFVVNTSSETRTILFRFMREKEAKKLFEKMPTQDCVDVLENVSERRFKRYMELMDLKKAKEIQEQRKHARNTAGRLMTTEILAFDMEKSIKDASDYIHDHPRIDVSRGIYVLNNQGEIQGHVPVRNILVNSPSAILKQVMRSISHFVHVEVSRTEIIDLFERYKLSSLPVVDENQRLLGVISQEDVLEAMEDVADEAFAKISGTSENISIEDSIFKRILMRSPWLFVTLLAGLVNVGIMSSFQKIEGAFLTFVLFFVPLITGMSGNIGIQCSTVLVRGIAFGLISKKTRKQIIYKELCTGLLTGLIFGFLCFVLVYFIDLMTNSNFGANPIVLGTIVGLGLIGACFAGSFLGVFSPVFFAKVGVDPAIASGPIVTAFNDVLSMTIYFIISYGLFLLFLS